MNILHLCTHTCINKQINALWAYVFGLGLFQITELGLGLRLRVTVMLGVGSVFSG